MKRKNSGILPFPPGGIKPSYNAKQERERNVVGVRIAEARKRSGMSLTVFSEYLRGFGIEVSMGCINKWENGNTIPNAYQLIAVCKALNITEEFDYFSLACQPPLNEAGMKKVAEYTQDLVASGRYPPNVPALNVVTVVELPVSDLFVSAGTGEYLDQGRFETRQFPASDVPEGTDFAVEISGDSMEPVFHDGQIVFVARCESLDVNDVGIFIYDGEGYVKVYSEQDPEDGERDLFTDSYGVCHKQSVLLSYNAKYLPKKVSPNVPFRIVGKVLF